MASPRVASEDKISDDLEIVSVGALYSGSWDKKYWSSSRGKDRFPYPVGYKAVRAHNGNTYYMEIEEGSKGPLFLIRHLAELWTGQTPDIAWGKFQKTSFSSHLKIWHGKRFTCKMNGTEFFGFRNPLVQRLLRELVTKSHGTEESSSSSRVSQIRVNDERPAVDESPNLLCYLDGPMVRKKRSKKTETVDQNSVVKDDHKKARFQDPLSGGENLSSAPVSTCSAKGEVEIVDLQGATPELLHSSHATNQNIDLPSENPPQVNVVIPIQETDGLPDSCNSKPLSKFSEEFHGLQEKECKPNNDIFLHDSQDTTVSNLCAPDTLDSLQDNTISSAPKMDYNSSCEQKEELTLASMVVSEAVLAEPSAEHLAESGLNLTSKDSDSYSADQETAKSMISFLIPQAIPLLKKASSKKPPKVNMSGTLSPRLNCSDNCKISQPDDPSGTAVTLSIRTCSGDDENMNAVAPDSVQDFTSDALIAPDSFDEFHLDIPRSGHIVSYKEAHPENLLKMPISKEQVAILNANRLAPALDAVHIVNPPSHDDITVLEENNQDVNKSMSIPHCTNSTNRILCQEPEEICAAKGNLKQTEHHSENKILESISCSTEGNDYAVGKTPTEVGSIRKEKHKVYTRKRLSANQQGSNRNSSFESKNSCSNTGVDDSISKMSPVKTPCILELQPTLSTNSISDRNNQAGDESCLVKEQYQGPKSTKVNNNKITNVLSDEMCVVSQDMKSANAFEIPSISPSSFQAHADEALGIQVSGPPSTKSQCNEDTREKSISSVPEVPASSNLKLNRDITINNEMEKTVELLGCYFHPMPVSSVSLLSVGNEIYICVLSFPTEDRVRTLFTYKISAKAQTKGFPSVVGHTRAILPVIDNQYGGKRILERSYLHFTPDGQHLIFIGNIKIPYCRKREMDCSCLTCTSACSEEENVVRIVQLKTGYVSLVTKLQAVDSVQCVVVCDSKYLVAVVKSGNLSVWAMNSDWRGPTEEFVILANPCISSCMVELKKIPKCPHLVIGHNGIGEFTIWDISKRSLVLRFVSPSNVIFEFIPTSLFAWHPVHSNLTTEDQVDMFLAATKLWFSKGINNKTLVPAEVKDTAIWLLVSTDHDSDAKWDRGESPARCWRLALLVRNQVILGSQLGPRAVVAGTVSGHGIAGTVDGLVYLWDLTTGTKLGSLHDFKGEGVSCISSDDSGNVCIASKDGQLLVYCHPVKENS